MNRTACRITRTNRRKFSITGAHTQNIERLWRDLRHFKPKYGARKHRALEYLAEFIFRQGMSEPADRLRAFWRTVADCSGREVFREVQQRDAILRRSTRQTPKEVLLFETRSARSRLD